MIFNPLRTLTGRLVLVTIIAVAISHLLAFALSANERGSAFKRESETNAIDRIVVTAQRIREAPVAEHEALAAAASDFGTRFSIVDTPLSGMGGGSGQRIARAVSHELGVATRARARIVEADLPRRWRVMRRLDHTPGPGGPPPRDQLERIPPEGVEFKPESAETVRRRITEVSVDVQVEPQRWLRVRTYLPAPRPAPLSYWFAALASMIAVGVGAALVARQIGRPLADLAHAAQRLGAGEPDVAAPVSGPEDVRRASTAFNAMAERLGRQMNRQRQMLWALSHDLRTPITALKLRTELLEDEAVKARLVGPLEEIETLTEQALTLARAGASEEVRTEVDLSEIAHTLCAELDDMGVPAKAEAPIPVIAACRPDEIARAMRNLAENAARHGGGGVMRVYRNDANEAVIEVVDEGPGLAPELLARVSEPFFRVDAARSGEGAAGQKGAGLGLAIVQAIADSHGGRLELENRTPRGLSAKLILPA